MYHIFFSYIKGESTLLESLRCLEERRIPARWRRVKIGEDNFEIIIYHEIYER